MAVVQLKKVPDGMELEEATEEEQKEMFNNLHKEPEEITDIKIIEVEEIPDDVKVVEVEEEKASEFVEKVERLKEERKIYINAKKVTEEELKKIIEEEQMKNGIFATIAVFYAGYLVAHITDGVITYTTGYAPSEILNMAIEKFDDWVKKGNSRMYFERGNAYPVR